MATRPLWTGSIASLLLTTEALITDLPEKSAAMPPMPHGGGDF